jgi:DNA mismatch repair protein MutL
MAPAIVQEPHLFDPLPPQEPKKQPSLEVIGAVQKYILATSHETSPELTVIDQRAAHARIIFEKLLTSTPEHQEMQLLLVPYIIELSVSDASTLRSQLESLQNAGIQIKEFGHTSFAIDAIPQIFGSVDLHKLIDEILKNSYEENDPTIVKREHQKKLAQAASRAAIASGKHLSRFEAQQLVDQLVQCRHPLQCPYGKTTMVKLSSHDIGKLFQSSG